MLYELCQIAKELLSNLSNAPSTTSISSMTSSENTVASTDTITLIEVNHMRDQSRYVQNLSNWADELQINLKVLHLKFRKRNNHWIIVMGSEGKVKSFKKNLRTQNVDIDSKGRPCKERLAKELSSQNVLQASKNFVNDVIEEDITSVISLKSWFVNFEISNLLDQSFLEHDD